MKKLYQFIPGVLLALGSTSCSDFLEAYSQDMVIPSTVTDLDEVLLGSVYIPSQEIGVGPSGMRSCGFFNILDDDVNTGLGDPNGDNTSNVNGWRNCLSSIYGYFAWQLDVGTNYNSTSVASDVATWSDLYARINYVNVILDEITLQMSSSKMTAEEKTTLKLGIGRIPEILLDTTDRNRTSPFAFTGNRFEFRAAGSSSNCAAAMIAINAAMANQLNEFKASVDKAMEDGTGKEEAIFRILREMIIASAPIRFEGDGYSEEWKQEAARRGLTNICHVPEALMHYVDDQSRSVLIGEHIFNETELNSRLEVELEKFTMKVQIESRVLGDLAINHIVPTAVSYQNRLLENLRGLRETFTPEEYEELSADRKELIREISRRVTAIKMQVRQMTEARKVANHMDSYKDKAFAYEETVRPYLESIRDHIDHLEMEVDDEIWPLPKYRELLFTK